MAIDLSLDRRAFLALIAAGMAPFSARAAVLSHFSAGMGRSGEAYFARIEAGEIAARLPLPARAHDAAVSRDGQRLAVFARRPGGYALVLSPDFTIEARLTPPPGRHFNGHGCFSIDGAWLFTSENDFTQGRGIIGVHDARRGFARVAEWHSGGVGPHDLRLTKDGNELIVANGGIDTHPDTGRDILNRDTMRASLALVSASDGRLLDKTETPGELRLLSLRHLALRPDGAVIFAAQYEGGHADGPPLSGSWRPGESLQFFEMNDVALTMLDNYIGSVAVDETGRLAALTSPRGGAVALVDVETGRLRALHRVPDACGVAALRGGGFLVSSGAVGLHIADERGARKTGSAQAIWDNHLTPARVD